MDCDFCTNTEFKLKVYNIGGERHIWRPSENRIYHLGSDINSYDPEYTTKALLKRNYPDVEDGSQQEPIFVPETFLPPRSKYGITPIEANIDLFQENIRLFLHDEKEIKDELRRFKGSIAEMSFYDELQNYFKGKEVFILHGYCLNNIPLGYTKRKKEIDFIIINKEHRYIMVLEVKYSLFRGENSGYCPVKRALHQLSKTKELFDILIGDIQLNGWRFIGAIGFMEHSKTEKQLFRCCLRCTKFLVQQKSLKSFFVNFEHYLQDMDDGEGYKTIIAKLLFTIFAFPRPLLRCDIDEKTAHTIGEQGKCENILFWTPSQFNLVQLNYEGKPRYKNVLFTSSFSTGKTEVMRYMMLELVKRKKKCHFIVCNTTKLVPLLFIQFTLLVEKMEEIEKQYIQISLVENLGSCLNVDLKVLWKKIAQYPNHFTFVDEFVVNLKNNRTEMEVKNGIINDIKTLTKVNKVFCLDSQFSALDNIILYKPICRRAVFGSQLPEFKKGTSGPG